MKIWSQKQIVYGDDRRLHGQQGLLGTCENSAVRVSTLATMAIHVSLFALKKKCVFHASRWGFNCLEIPDPFLDQTNFEILGSDTWRTRATQKCIFLPFPPFPFALDPLCQLAILIGVVDGELLSQLHQLQVSIPIFLRMSSTAVTVNATFMLRWFLIC